MADAFEDAMLLERAAEVVPEGNSEPSGGRPRVARVAESGTIGAPASGLRVTVVLLRDLQRRRQFQPTAPDACAAFRDISFEWMGELGHEPSPEERERLENPEGVFETGGFIWIALTGNEPIGCVALIRRECGGEDNPEEAGGTMTNWELAMMGVKQSYRRKGVGRRMCEALFRQFGEADREGRPLTLEVPTAAAESQAFFRRVSFEEAPEALPSIGGGVTMLYRGTLPARRAPPGQ
eukprot:TRINITY_DN14882_c0_g1_i2.p1 TRINITY_DN14882_c0_g1~~TRINITY_DN14882_c0_g1_i2.p1  ORF type:complete len:237 (-),score=58.22 TRINITY_DN14882_c0_g1_i2:196-906(-)